MPENRPAIPRDIERKIFVEAGHHCACCGESLSLERAHIVPWREVKEHTVENLLCLCANCHGKADSEWDKKTFYMYKQNPWVYRRVSTNTSSNKSELMHNKDVSALRCLMEFMPFIYLRGYVDKLPRSIDTDFWLVQDMFENFKRGNPHLYPFSDKELNFVFDNFITKHEAISSLMIPWTTYKDKGIFDTRGSTDQVYFRQENFSREEGDEVREIIVHAKNDFEEAYEKLITYLREFYPEVNLAAYKKCSIDSM